MKQKIVIILYTSIVLVFFLLTLLKISPRYKRPFAFIKKINIHSLEFTITMYTTIIICKRVKMIIII